MSITTRIWGATIAIVLLVLFASGAVHSSIVSQMYLGQQKDELRAKTGYLAYLVGRGEEPRRLADTAERLGVNLMVVGVNGDIRQCVGIMDPEGVLSGEDHHPMVLSAVQTGAGSYFYTGPNQVVGGKVLAMVYPLQDGNTLVVSTLFSPIEATLAALHLTSVYVGIGALLLTGVLGFAFSRALSRPLKEMTVVAGAMAEGDFSRRVAGGSSLEVNALAVSLNTLATELEVRVAEIHRLDETRRDFVANVAHEVRTPLAIIQASTEALEDGIPSTEEERAAYLGNISAELQRLRLLTDELLDLRQLESRFVRLNREAVLVTGLIEDAVTRFQRPAADKGIAIILHCAEELPPVYGDRGRLGQVLANLLGNAVRHSPEGGSITTTVRHLDDQVVITVADTGPGIDPDDLPLVFERFYKADRSRTRHAGSGTGLGLAITKELVEAHGGTLQVESVPGEGARFTVRLPVFVIS